MTILYVMLHFLQPSCVFTLAACQLYFLMDFLNVTVQSIFSCEIQIALITWICNLVMNSLYVLLHVF